MPNDILHLFCRDGLQSKPLQEQAMSKTPVLEMRNIAKVFGKFYALKGVDLTVYPGEIHALMGENGAGKSTLMKILAGAYTATSGEILIDGQPFNIKGPKDALAAGITLIYQEMQLAPI
jgi:ribose transport system ATP-binding protein